MINNQEMKTYQSYKASKDLCKIKYYIITMAVPNLCSCNNLISYFIYYLYSAVTVTVTVIMKICQRSLIVKIIHWIDLCIRSMQLRNQYDLINRFQIVVNNDQLNRLFQSIHLICQRSYLSIYYSILKRKKWSDYFDQSIFIF